MNMDPKSSPNSVRRVTKLPIIIGASVIMVFAGVIAISANERGKETAKKVTAPPPVTSSAAAARQIIKNQMAGLVPATKPTAPNTQAIPIAATPPMPPPMPEQDDQLVQAKAQVFAAAVKANTSVALPSSTTAANATPSTSTANNIKVNKWLLDSKVTAPDTHYELRAGGVIPGIMISGINSELPGQIMGQVAENVYDTATGNYLLIPQGTRLIGTYSNHVIYGQSAVLIAWQRLIFPDGKALDIGAMSGADSAGYSGFRDQVNNHYLRTFGSALLMSLMTAGISYNQDSHQSGGFFTQPTMSNELSQALGQQLGQVTAQLVTKNLNIAPTLQIRPGYQFNIIVTKDIAFTKPYHSFDYGS